jgi:hypothetical protein
MANKATVTHTIGGVSIEFPDLTPASVEAIEVFAERYNAGEDTSNKAIAAAVTERRTDGSTVAHGAMGNYLQKAFSNAGVERPASPSNGGNTPSEGGTVAPRIDSKSRLDVLRRMAPGVHALVTSALDSDRDVDKARDALARAENALAEAESVHDGVTASWDALAEVPGFGDVKAALDYVRGEYEGEPSVEDGLLTMAPVVTEGESSEGDASEGDASEAPSEA